MGKVAVIGIDGGMLKLVEQWQDELPNFRRIMQNGVYGELESTFPPLTCPAWPSMFTGKNPGKLGIFDFNKYRADKGGEFSINSSLDYASSALWKILNSYGKKVGIFNLPFTFPPHKVDSFMVCGVGSPDVMKANYTYPPELQKTLNEVVGGYEIVPLILLGIQGKEEQYIKVLEGMLGKREKAASYLLANMPWDLFVGVFYILDAAQHYFWHHMDQNHTRPGDKRYQDVIKRFYIKVDGAIGRFLEQVPEDTNVLVVSDHGFGPIHGYFMVNQWLENNNFLRFKDKIHQKRLGVSLRLIRDFLMSYLSPRLSQLVADLLPRAVARKITFGIAQRDNMAALYQSIDWSQTKAYGMGMVGMIYINLKGREPWGTVEPGEEYEAVRDEIIAKLKQIIDPETGKTVDIQVFKKEELYHGQYFELAPDILYKMARYDQSLLLKDKAEWRQAHFSGWHVQEGMFMGWGPDIDKSGRKLSGLRIYDISPTILHLFGLPVPQDMDGRVLTEIFQEESEPGRREVTYQEVDYETERIKHIVRKLKTQKQL